MKKPMLSVDQLIVHMKSKGIKFTIVSEQEARQHLAAHNNYFKLSCYRKNYTKVTTGADAGKYENLEFAYLRELARIDTEVRHLLLDMCLDIEHFMKVLLIKEVENNMIAQTGEDGYKIVSNFLLDEGTQSISDRANNVAARSGNFSRKVRLNVKNPYCKGLIQNYSDELPVWAYVELISFGDLKDLIEYYSKSTGWVLPVDIQSLDRVRQVRNACAHGNAIINDLKPVQNQNSVSTAPKYITDFVINAGVGKDTRKRKLSNPRINQIVHLLFVYDKVVSSKNTRSMRIQQLKDLINIRMTSSSYFSNNALLRSTHVFFKKIIDTMS